MRTLHVISHTHWDREWYLTFQQFRLKLVQLVDNLLDILENDPDYKYFMLDGQTIVLDDYLAMRPEKEPILREHIKNGCIIIGPWHILPDMFLVGPEAHIRNLLEGERTTKKFGTKMMVGYMPDSFGHIGQMPQILRGFGIEKACLWRGPDAEPAEFWWQSPDGSRVLLAYLRDSYSNGAFLPNGELFPLDSMPRFAEAISERGQSLAEHSNAEDLLIMLGTDHMQPSRNTTRNIAYANENLKNTRVVHSTLSQYFAALQQTMDESKLPIVEGELRSCKRMHLLPGVLSTRMWIKQRNSGSENLLTKWVEPFSTFVEMIKPQNQKSEPGSTGLRDQAAIIRKTWQLLMENHPHDSICGCSIDRVHNEMKARFDQVDQIGEELTRQNLETIANRIQTEPLQSANQNIGSVIVFNPCSFSRSDSVSTELQLAPDTIDFALLDENGNEIAYETVGLGAKELINTSFSAKEFPAAFAMVSDGRFNGLGIRAFHADRDGSTVHIDISMAEGEPEHAVWEQAVKEYKTAIEDASLTSYQVRVHISDKVRVVFTASDVPALGWRSYILQSRNTQSTPIKLSPIARAILPLAARIARRSAGHALVQHLQNKPNKNNGHIIENEFFRVVVESDGTLSVMDKQSGSSYHGLNRFVDGGDSGDEYNYSPPLIDLLQNARLKEVHILRSPIRQIITLNLVLKTPAMLTVDRKSRSHDQVEIPIKSVITLTNKVPRIDIHTSLENRAKDHRLRVHFPTPFNLESADYDGHFEVPNRKIGLPRFDRKTWIEDPRPEAPQRAFIELSESNNVEGVPKSGHNNEKHGLTLANRGLPEVEVLKKENGTEIALTLLRCVGWLSRDDLQTRRSHAGPGLETPGAQMPGTWDFDYAIIPHNRQLQVFPRLQAYGFETPLRAMTTTLHKGDLPGKGSFLRVECIDPSNQNAVDGFILSAVKQAEDGSGWIVRGYNPGYKTSASAGSETVSQVTITPLNPWQFAVKVNLAEQKIADLPVDKSTGSVSLEVKNHEIVTVWFGAAPKQ